jgi:hypothetical protein
MTKVENKVKSASAVGLSYYAESHRLGLDHYIEVSEFINGETRIKYKQSFNSQSKPPTREVGKEIEQTGLTLKAKSKIRQAANTIQYINQCVKGRSGAGALVTLTYGREVPSHKEAKKMLDIFLKRTRRFFGYNIEYVWVAENQKRGAIHFHLYLPEYLPKEFINSAWNSIVNKWMIKERQTTQLLHPNVIGVSSVGAYLSKYISKESGKINGNLYGISSSLRELMKPTITTQKMNSEADARLIMDSAHDTLENLNTLVKTWNSGTTRFIWTTNGDYVVKSIKENILINQSKIEQNR